MNEWAKRTIDLVETGDYLDRLQDIYPIAPRDREVPEPVLNAIKEAFEARDKDRLIEILLDDVDVFPYKDSYVAFLRKDRPALKRNPKTAARIYTTLIEMGLKKIIEGVRAPVESNTMRGQSFNVWARKNFKYVSPAAFEISRAGICFMDASDTDLRDYANTLGCSMAKRPDLVAKSGTKIVVGEAKFLSDSGGESGRRIPRCDERRR